MGGGDFLKGCNLAPRGVVNKLSSTALGLFFCFPHQSFSEPMVGDRIGKTAPCRETTPSAV